MIIYERKKKKILFKYYDDCVRGNDGSDCCGNTLDDGNTLTFCPLGP